MRNHLSSNVEILHQPRGSSLTFETPPNEGVGEQVASIRPVVLELPDFLMESLHSALLNLFGRLIPNLVWVFENRKRPLMALGKLVDFVYPATLVSSQFFRLIDRKVLFWKAFTVPSALRLAFLQCGSLCPLLGDLLRRLIAFD